MLFLPKKFNYNLNCQPIIILNKIQERIKPPQLKPKYAEEYDFQGYVTDDTFYIELNPPWNPLVKKGFVCPYLSGEFKSNENIIDLTVSVKFRNSDYLILLLFALIFATIGTIRFFDTNVIQFLIMPIVEFCFVYIFFVFMARINIRDIRERLESILIEYKVNK